MGTESASAATSSKVTLAAEVNPNNQETTYEFEYATNKALTGASKEPGAAPLTGLGNQPASVTLSGLKAGETYFYRVDGDVQGYVDAAQRDGGDGILV